MFLIALLAILAPLLPYNLYGESFGSLQNRPLLKNNEITQKFLQSSSLWEANSSLRKKTLLAFAAQKQAEERKRARSFCMDEFNAFELINHSEKNLLEMAKTTVLVSEIVAKKENDLSQAIDCFTLREGHEHLSQNLSVHNNYRGANIVFLYLTPHHSFAFIHSMPAPHNRYNFYQIEDAILGRKIPKKVSRLKNSLHEEEANSDYAENWVQDCLGEYNDATTKCTTNNHGQTVHSLQCIIRKYTLDTLPTDPFAYEKELERLKIPINLHLKKYIIPNAVVPQNKMEIRSFMFAYNIRILMAWKKHLKRFIQYHYFYPKTDDRYRKYQNSIRSILERIEKKYYRIGDNMLRYIQKMCPAIYDENHEKIVTIVLEYYKKYEKELQRVKNLDDYSIFKTIIEVQDFDEPISSTNLYYTFFLYHQASKFVNKSK